MATPPFFRPVLAGSVEPLLGPTDRCEVSSADDRLCTWTPTRWGRAPVQRLIRFVAMEMRPGRASTSSLAVVEFTLDPPWLTSRTGPGEAPLALCPRTRKSTAKGMSMERPAFVIDVGPRGAQA